MRSYMFSLFVGTLIAFTVWLSILITVNPDSTDIITRMTFFASLFLSLTGFFSFIYIYIMSLIETKYHPTKLVSRSLLRATLLSFTIVFLLVLQTLRVLNTWEIIIVILLYLLTELYIKFGKRELI